LRELRPPNGAVLNRNDRRVLSQVNLVAEPLGLEFIQKKQVNNLQGQ
jgi:hypothetical protein